MTEGTPSMRVEPDITETTPEAARRRHAVSDFLRQHPALLLPLSSSFVYEQQPTFESSIRGPSMEPAIPSRARLRIQVCNPQLCQPGDVVFYLTDAGYMVHRIVYKPQHSTLQDYVLTCGDHCLTPDPPVRYAQILGTVVAIQKAGSWRPVDPPIPRSFFRRTIRVATLTLMRLVLRCNAHAASCLAKRLRQLELIGRMAVWRYWRHGLVDESER